METKEHLDLSSIEWMHVLPRLGIEERLIANPKRRGPCPICGGKSRFRFTNEKGRGTWVCNCGAGDGVRLIAAVHGISDAKAIIELRELIFGPGGAPQKFTRKGPPPEIPTKTPEDIEKARIALRNVWEGGSCIAGTPALSYLQNRVRELDPQWLTKAFRFHPSLYHMDEDQGRVSHLPAMISLVNDASNPDEIVSIHRTYLDGKGGKAAVSPGQAKKMMTAVVEKISGHSIKLNKGHGPVAIVTEGIENGLAWVAAHRSNYPVYAGINCYNLAAFRWPVGTKVLIICGDHDPVNPKTGVRPGFHNAMLLKQRAVQAGLTAVVKIPQIQGIDWDELWNAGELSQFRLLKSQRQQAMPA